MAYQIAIAGLDELRKRMRADRIFGEPLREALTEAADEVKLAAEAFAPRETGRLAQGIRRTVSRQPVPKAAWVRANVTKKGFRYGWALNFSVVRPYRYRSTARRGRRTFHWFEDARDATKPKVQAILARASARIEADWRR